MILISAFPADYHSIAAHLALATGGVDSVLVDLGQIPFAQVIANSRTHDFIIEASSALNISKVDTVWHRRLTAAKFPNVDERDREFAEKEAEEFYHNFIAVMESYVDRWINPLSQSRSRRSKAAQEIFARNAGVSTPASIISNDSRYLEDLFVNADVGGYICKFFTPRHWVEDGQTFELMTCDIDRDKLNAISDDFLLPLVVQNKIKKSYEVRITCFGGFAVSIALNSQRFEATSTDWRMIHSSALEPELIEPPGNIKLFMKQLMQHLDIVFGCFDFIVDESGTWVFLEVNPQGQFLFVEESIPESNLLSTMCEYLCHNGSPWDFEPSGQGGFPSLSTVDQKAKSIYNEELMNGNIDPIRTYTSA